MDEHTRPDIGRQAGHRVQLQLRCPPAPAPVEGELECEDGSIRPFTGWLGLVNELERVVAGHPAAGDR